MDSKRTSRRELLKGGAALAGGLTLGAVGAERIGTSTRPSGGPGQPKRLHPMIMGSKELVEYGQRSHYVTSVRIAHPMGGRPSPDVFGKVFHVASPLQDSVGVITPSSLHYVATTRGSFIPDIDPKQHTLMIHGLVDRPLTFTMEDLKRLPSVTRLHFIECAGNRHNARAKDRAGNARDDQLRRMDRRAPFNAAQGVRPERQRDMVRRRRRRGSEGRLEHAHRQSDGRLPHRLRHERRGRAAAERFSAAPDGPRLRGNLPHQVSAAHQGRRPVLHELQRLRASPIGIRKRLRSASRSDPSRSSRTRPADSSCPAADSTRSAGWPGPAGAPFVPWRYPPMAGRSGTSPRSRGLHNAWRTPGSAIRGIGMETRPRFFRAAPTRSGRCNRRESRSPSTGTCLLSEITECLG